MKPVNAPVSVGALTVIVAESPQGPLRHVLVALEAEGPRSVTELVRLVSSEVDRVDLLHQPAQGVSKAALGAGDSDGVQGALGCFFGSIHADSKAWPPRQVQKRSTNDHNLMKTEV